MSKKPPSSQGDNMDSQIQTTAQELLSLMGFTPLSIEVMEVESGVFQVEVAVDQNDSGVLIGYHGEGVDALQLVINLIINKDREEWVRISVNVNDYRQQREEIVRNMALKAAENAKTTGKAVILNYLPSHERRIAHIILSEDPEIETYSEGVGKYRRLVISPLV